MLIITSTPHNVAQVEPYVDSIAQEYNLPPDKYGDILISLTEAVNNAIIHGNNKDESKCVEINCCKQTGHSIAISVSDQGAGFDPECVPDPTSNKNICREGGRGVWLMKELSDAIFFRNNGSTVELRFNL